MKNLWVQNESAVAAWHADLTACLAAPTKLLTLVRAVYEAAAATRVVLPTALDVVTATLHRWESESTIDMFRLVQKATSEAELAWYSRSGEVQEGRVGDLGSLLESLQPAPNTIALHDRARGFPPVALLGGQLVYAGTPAVCNARGPVTFSVTLHSDIWFPYVIGASHPARDLERFFDNSELAKRHTPRLNAFLSKVARLVADAGGRWALDGDDSSALYLPWLSADGIRLDGSAPTLMAASVVDCEWPDLDD